MMNKFLIVVMLMGVSGPAYAVKNCYFQVKAWHGNQHHGKHKVHKVNTKFKKTWPWKKCMKKLKKRAKKKVKQKDYFGVIKKLPLTYACRGRSRQQRSKV